VDIKQAVYKVLSTNSGITALASGGVFGGKLPQRITAPAIVFRLEDTEDMPILNSPGVSNLTKSTFRFGCVARGDGNGAYDIASELDAALRACLQGLSGTISDDLSPESTIGIAGAWRIHASDFYDDPTETYWVRSDWEIHHALT